MFFKFIILVVSISSLVKGDNYATYPQVPKTASYNGFADPIIDVLPDCAKECVKYSTGNTPCPNWDTGCLCVMPQWSGLVGQCIAKNCTGSDVQSARYWTTSLCSTVGANTWWMPASISTMLSTAAEGAAEITTISDKTARSWVVASGSSDTNISPISFVQAADNYATYPKIPKTASINGFADPIVDLLPDCAKECVKFSTKNTPCPYWDTGCFCVMPQWAGLVGQCIAKNCKGEDVQSARFLATSLCSTVGANTWMMPASISDMMSSAASGAKEVTTISGKTAMQWVTAPGSSDTNVVSETDNSESVSETSDSSSASATDSDEETSATSESAESASSTEASSTANESSTTSTGSTSNLAVLQAGSLGSVIFGVLVSFLM
ncbi:unnamed protein product [Candida parapsilosis]